MNRVSFRCLLPLLAAALLVLPAMHAQEKGRGRKYTPPPPTCKITVTVVRSYNGKPVENAAVVFHPVKDGKDQGNMELKTNEDGRAVLDVIPVGDTVRLQVIADGFQTFGEQYELPGDSKEIMIKLRRPTKQYSIYQNHPGQNDTENKDNQQDQQKQKPQ
jgi:hypothetical protein